MTTQNAMPTLPPFPSISFNQILKAQNMVINNNQIRADSISSISTSSSSSSMRSPPNATKHKRSRSRDSNSSNELISNGPNRKKRKLNDFEPPLPPPPPIQNSQSLSLNPSIFSLSADMNNTNSLNPNTAITPTPTRKSNVNILSQSLPTQQLQQTHADLLGLNIPNIHISSVPSSASSNSSSQQQNMDQMNRFLFGQQAPAQIGNLNLLQNAYPAINQLFGHFSVNDIDKELEKEMNKKAIRQNLYSQLHAIQQQIKRQELEDEPKLQTLKIIKMVQMNQQKNKLPIPNLIYSIPQIPSLSRMMQSKPTLIGYSDKKKSNQLKLPNMSQSNEWKSVLNAEEFKKSVNGHIECKEQREYKGYGRETLIAASNQTQCRSKMTPTQMAVISNLMIEMSFTETLICSSSTATTKAASTNDKIKIDPAICLNMNLNKDKSKMNGFSAMIGSPNKMKQSVGLNICPPSFQQTSNLSMPSLEAENIRSLASPASSDSVSTFSSEIVREAINGNAKDIQKK